MVLLARHHDDTTSDTDELITHAAHSIAGHDEIISGVCLRIALPSARNSPAILAAARACAASPSAWPWAAGDHAAAGCSIVAGGRVAQRDH
jgi:hypothetical protein